MNISYEELVKKILKFWKTHENQKFTPEILKSTFNKEEIEIICFDEHFYHEYFVIKKFIDLLPDVSTFYNSKESEALFYKYYDTNSEIFDLVKNFDKQQILSLFERESEQARLYYLLYIKDDDILLSLYEKTNNKDIKLEIVTRFNSDELKLKYLKEFTKSGRIEIISSFKDKSLIEGQLSILNPNKGALISALDVEKKSLYFKKYFWYMNKDEHSRIISSIKDEQLVIELLKECSDQTKSYI